jgi:hypothetical protein
MPKGGNPKHSKPHKIPMGSRVFITENFTDDHRTKPMSSYSGRTKRPTDRSKASLMLSEHFRNE